MDDHGSLDKSDINQLLYNILMYRRKWNMNWVQKISDYIYPLIKRFKCGKCCMKAHKYEKFYKEASRYQTAKKKFNKELDLISLLKVVRDSQNFMKNFFSTQ